MLTDKALATVKKLSEPTLYAPVAPEMQVKRVLGTPVKTIQIGGSGTNIYGGYLTEDYLAELNGTKAAKIYDKMRRSDPRIKMVTSAVKNPIKSADWCVRILPDLDETLHEIAEKQKEFISYILFKDLGKSWKKSLHEILSMIDFGNTVLEVTNKVVLKHKKFGPYIGLKSLKLIGQKTIERFNVNKDGDLQSVTQYSSGDTGRNVSIPAEFIMHFAIDKEGDNYEGISMLRTCYGPWLRKNNALKQESVGNQNYGTPIAVMSVPDGVENTQQYKDAISFLENYSNNQASYLIKPDGWELDLKSNVFDSSKIRETIKSENEEITFAFLANFLNLGSGGSGGSYALSNDLSDFFTSSLEFIAGEIVETFNNTIIPALIKLNFPNVDCMVELSVSGIADRAGLELAQVVELLGRNRSLTNDRELEETLRKRYKLPPMPPMPEELDENGVPVAKVDDVQTTALNGAQVSSMVEIVSNFRTGVLSRESAVAMMKAAFNVDEDKAQEIVGPDMPKISADQIVNSSRTFAEAQAKKKEKPNDVSKRISANGERLKQVFRDGLTPIAEDIINKLIAKYNTKTDARNHYSVFDIKPSGVGAYNKKLREEFDAIVNEAYKSVASNYKFADKTSLNRARAKADILSMTQLNDIEKAIYLQFGSSVDSTDSEATLRKDLHDAANKAMINIDVGADISSAQLENETRMDFFDDIKDEVESFTFYNPAPEAAICTELDGVTFSIDDPDLERYTPPLHPNCKSVMIPNLRGDKNNPEITGLPSISEAGKKSLTLHECKH